MPLHGETEVWTVGGPVKLSELDVLDEPIPAFCWDGYRIWITKIYGCYPIGSRQIVRVDLDNGSSVKTNASTRFVGRDGEYLYAQSLSNGSSLMPLYTSKDSHGYPIYKENSKINSSAPSAADKCRNRKISRLVAEWMNDGPLDSGTYVEHIDGDKENYHPSNLRVIKKLDKIRRTTNYKITELVDEAGEIVREMDDNHKVENIEMCAIEEMYDLQASPTSNVAVSGVFIETYC